MTKLCACGCGHPAPRGRFAGGCYKRWVKAGRPASGPPPPKTPEQRRPPPRSAERAGRIEDYAELRSWGLSLQDAAARMGLTTRTVERYEAELKRHQQQTEAA